ncbi:YbfB/YjiJ family MFS transporter [Parathalassolituus penaei]|uniref:YbfB/YjiJ family MFS transporter n=1 Tax=Parathalassolituus penaei TaxID=2997323 RepID=A0A9X3EAP0_9GAMM|nr:YbfB/YjiJ family MFS transporter [Parathalassolituus penaei]MCY0964067.1 YbfB/YjiJ family MFS transporter [Parathalassolituus penaei]
MTVALPLPTTSADRLRVICAGICALILSVGLARFAYTPMLPVMRDEAGLTAVAGGWLATFNYVGYIAGALLAASISNLKHKFVIYRAGLLIALFSTAAMGLTQDAVLWTLLRLVSGFSSTAGLLLASGLILNWLIRHGYKPELGLHFTGMGLGIVVSGVAAGTMAGQLAWDQQWLVLGALGLLFFIPAWCWLPEPQPMNSHQQQTRPAVAAPPARWMWLMIAAYFCAGFGYVISATFIVAILEDLPMLTGKGGWVWVIVGVAALPSSFLWDRINRALGDFPTLLLAYGLQIVSMALPLLSDGVAWNLLSAVLYGGTFVGIVSLTLTLIGRQFPDNPAKAMARLTISYGISQVAAPAIAGYIAAATGSYLGSLLMAGVMMVLGMFLLVLLWRGPQASA